MSSVEQERDNFFCLARLLFDVGNQTLREYFKNRWPTVLYSATGFVGTAWSDLSYDGHQLLTVDRRLRLDPNERPKVQAGDTKDWDFTILTKVLMHSSLGFVARGSSKYVELDRLRTIRNKMIGHAKEARLPTAVYGTVWQDASDALKLFGADHGDMAAITRDLEQTRIDGLIYQQQLLDWDVKENRAVASIEKVKKDLQTLSSSVDVIKTSTETSVTALTSVKQDVQTLSSSVDAIKTSTEISETALASVQEDVRGLKRVLEDVSGKIEKNVKKERTAENLRESNPFDGCVVLLKDEYNRRASRVQPLPWLDDVLFHLETIYTRLGIVEREKERSRRTDKTVELADIFKPRDYCPNPKSVLIEGSPGMGKTTTCLKVAYDWATGKTPESFPCFDVVLLIKCKDMKGDIWTAIEDQLLPTDIEPDVKKEFIRYIKLNQERVLLVVDGLDETPTKAWKHVMDLITRKHLASCFLMVTSRQDRGLEVRKYFDNLLEIKGYSETDTDNYARLYFKNRDAKLAERFLDELRRDRRLQSLATTPLNTALLCVVYEEFDGKLPSTQTELYEDIVFCLTKRYCCKECLPVEDDSILKDHRHLYVAMGKLAYEGLLEKRLNFFEHSLEAKYKDAAKIGFLLKEASESKLRRRDTYWFIHKTFQEFFSAQYLKECIETQTLTMGEVANSLQNAQQFQQVLLFLSGMFRENTCFAKSYVKELAKCFVKDEAHLRILCKIICESFIEVDTDITVSVYPFLPETIAIDGFTCNFAMVLLNVLKCSLRAGCKESVKRLIISFCTNAMLPALGDFVTHSQTLQELVIEYSHCKTDEAASVGLSVGLHKNTSLKKLVIIGQYLDNTQIEILLNAFMPRVLDRVSTVSNTFPVTESDTRMSRVESLQLIDMHSCDREVLAKAVATMLLSNTHLRSLNLNGSRLHCNALSCIFVSLKSNNFLHKLQFRFNKCGLDGARVLGDMLKTNRHLKHLVVADNPIGCDGICYIAESLRSNNVLHTLDLSSTKCGDRGAKAIADMMLTNNTLKNLWFCCAGISSRNTVGKLGASAVALALERNRSLKQLSLCGNEVTDEAFKCFCNALRVNQTLEKLCVGFKCHYYCKTVNKASRQSSDESDSQKTGDEVSQHSRVESVSVETGGWSLCRSTVECEDEGYPSFADNNDYLDAIDQVILKGVRPRWRRVRGSCCYRLFNLFNA